MKLKLTASMIGFVLSTLSFGASAQDYQLVPAPNFPLPAGSIPVLFPAEQGAYALIEAMMQITESYILNNSGCQATTRPLYVSTDQNGAGSAILGWPSKNVATSIAPLDAANPGVHLGGSLGRWYSVTGSGAFGTLVAANFTGSYFYSLGSQLMSADADWTLTSGNSSTVDRFKSRVIKDFWRPQLNTAGDNFTIPADGGEFAGIGVNSVTDWGYQLIFKNGYPKVKYWQASRTWRDDGTSAETHFKKTRVAPTGGCTIQVDLGVPISSHPATDGSAGIEGFSQYGYLRIIPDKPVTGLFSTPTATQ